MVLKLGERVAGDEKLFHFTGNSIDIRLVPSKPGHIGLWFYELCCPLKTGKSYLLSAKLHENSEKTTVASVVENWARVVKSIGHSDTLLTFDSYYMSQGSKQVLDQLQVFSAERFH